MRVHVLIFIIFICFQSRPVLAQNPEPWESFGAGIRQSRVESLFITHSLNPLILAGTEKALYRYQPKTNNFKVVLPQFQSGSEALENQQISQNFHQIYSPGHGASSIYTASEQGLFLSSDRGLHWFNIYAPQKVEERKCLCVLTYRENIFLGTNKGLRILDQKTRLWQKGPEALDQRAIYHIVDETDYVYVNTGSQVYRIKKSNQELKLIYEVKRIEEPSEFDTEANSPTISIHDLTTDWQNQLLIIATNHELITSHDQGTTWQKLPMNGLPFKSINRIIAVNNKKNIDYFAATGQGVFHLVEGQWQSENLGLPTSKINTMAYHPQGFLFAATDQGIYTRPYSAGLLTHNRELPDHENSFLDKQEELKQLFSREPSIGDVHRMAISYANVNPHQIAQWHKRAKLKAVMPKLTVGVNRSATELFHWDAGPNPDKLMRGRDFIDWDASLSWDFSDLLWNSDETTIDSRSKLMSELRNDILDQVTRLYFERRRLKAELALNSNGSDKDDFEKQNQFDEITALLNGLTGGEFCLVSMCN